MEVFATLEEARDAVRKLREAKKLQREGVEVVLMEGDLLFTQPFAVGEADGGAASSAVRYRAETPGRARLLGGKIVPQLAAVTDAATLNRLPEAARANVRQADLKALGITEYGTLKPRGFGRGGQPMALELFFDGNPMTLARWPNEEWLKIAGVPNGAEGGKFNYAEDRPNGWAANDDLWVHGYWTWDWADSFTKVAALDPAKKELTTTEPHGVYGYKEGARFYFLNVLEELDSPGEYYVDRESGTLYFWPPAPIEGKELAVSLLEAPLVTLDKASNISIEGIRFEYTRGPGLQMNGGAHNRIANCTFANLGTDALNISGGEDNGVDGCLLYNLGYGGIGLSGGDRKTLTAAGQFATNNEIHDFS
ncbi:MAG: right-handed parallel beta-helix repeat-containing protein, partial [Candidatus Hydrogenedentes bacterium]|nr:right-handed parallel beta-helix repeat-containing protein [Candidatus Hydrogenedentota bacterium]